MYVSARVTTFHQISNENLSSGLQMLLVFWLILATFICNRKISCYMSLQRPPEPSSVTFKMEAACSFETSEKLIILYVLITQKTVILGRTGVRNANDSLVITAKLDSRCESGLYLQTTRVK
jgi:hypothetical protein